MPSNAAVMLRFTRVVALPDPKNSDFPSRINTFVRLGCRIGDTRRADKRRVCAQITSSTYGQVNDNQRLPTRDWR